MAYFSFSGVLFLIYWIYQCLRRVISSDKEDQLPDGDSTDDAHLGRINSSSENHLLDGDPTDDARFGRFVLSGEDHLPDGDLTDDARFRWFVSSGKDHLLDGDSTDDACECPMIVISGGQGVMQENEIIRCADSESLTIEDTEIVEFLRSYERNAKYTTEYVSRREKRLYLKALNQARPGSFLLKCFIL